MLTKERLLADCDRRPRPFACEGYGDGYCLPLTCAEMDHVEYLLNTGGSFSAYIIARTLCDEHGQRQFADADESALAGGNPELRKVATAILKTAGKDKDLAAKLEKN